MLLSLQVLVLQTPITATWILSMLCMLIGFNYFVIDNQTNMIFNSFIYAIAIFGMTHNQYVSAIVVFVGILINMIHKSINQ